MKIIRKYTAIQLTTKNVDDSVDIKLSFGEVTGPYYSTTHPTEEFETEEEAIEYAYKQDRWNRWLIIPIIKFNNFN